MTTATRHYFEATCYKLAGDGETWEPDGLSVRYWVQLGRSTYGPFATFDEAVDELEAETKSHNAPRSNPADEVDWTDPFGETLPDPDEVGLATYSASDAFFGRAVKVGDAVAVVFRPELDLRPVFGYVRTIERTGDHFVTIDDVEYGRTTFEPVEVETVAVLPGRKPAPHQPCGSNCQIHCQPKGRS